MWASKPAPPLWRAMRCAARYLAGRFYELRTGGIPPEREWSTEYLPLRRIDEWGWPEHAFIVRGSGPIVYRGSLREIAILSNLPVSSYQDFSEIIQDGWRLQ